MGSIRGKWVKKMAFNLVELYPDKFGKDFDKNKKSLEEMKLVDDKSVRNKIAGLITSRYI